jgi:hypothetical protein
MICGRSTSLVIAVTCLLSSISFGRETHAELRIRGKVLTVQGVPAAGTSINLGYYEGQNYKIASCQSNDDGSYELRLPSVRIYSAIRFQHRDGTLSFQRFQFDPTDDKTEDGVIDRDETRLSPARKLQVRVIDGQRKPVAKAIVLVQANYEECARSISDDQGNSELLVPADATLQTIGAVKPGLGCDYRSFEDLSTGLVQSHPAKLSPDFAQPLELTLDGIHPCEVRVVDEDDKPVTGVTIRPWLITRPDRGEDWNLGGFQEFRRTTNSDGIAAFDMLPHDQVNLFQFWPSMERDDVYALGNSEGMHVDERAIVKLSDKPVATIRLKKYMRIAGTAKLPDGTPISGILIHAHGGYPTMGWSAAATKTDETGRWALNVKPDGYYLICVRDNKYSAKSYDGVILRQGEETPSFDFRLVPAKRIFGRITGKFDPQTYIMYQEKAKDYYQIPEEKRLPVPPNNNQGVSAFFQGGSVVSAKGEFEFFVGEGDYVIWNPEGGTESFQLTESDTHKEFSFHIDKPLTIKSTITVLDDKTDMPVPLVTVSGRSTNFKIHSHIDSVSNNEGIVHMVRKNCEHLLIATSKDKTLGGFVRLSAEEEEMEIYMSPTVKATGILVDKDDKPLANAELIYGIEVREGSLSSTLNEAPAQTDENGRFELPNLILNAEYTLSQVTQRDKKGRAAAWRILNRFLATEDMQLGILTSK